MKYVYAILLVFPAVLNVYAQKSSIRKQLSLNGVWKFRLDSLNVGMNENWQRGTFEEKVLLPGSLEENQKGIPVKQATTHSLNRTYKYVGAAWFQKEVLIPASWKNKQLELYLERTKATTVWIDEQLIGQCSLLSAPHVYNLTGKLNPGKHTVTIRVDNSPALFPVGGSHALSDDTQTNWNGMIGQLYLQASDKIKIDWVKINPDVQTRTAQVRIRVLNSTGWEQKLWVELNASAWNVPATLVVQPKRFRIDVKGRDTLLEFSYPLGRNAVLWSAYTPALYKLSVRLYDAKRIRDAVAVNFGLRAFRAEGKQFQINGVTTFLRGKNEGCIFPLTGYPPTDTAAWRKLYRTAKMYGINHFRFHSYTPPQAAFEAADVEGIYIQAELPNWANFTGKDTVRINFQNREGKAILDAYGNHPSFVLFTLGNELGGDKRIHHKMVVDFRAYDNRRLYADGTNAFYEDPKPGESDDFWVTMRTGKESADRRFDVRGSFACTEDRGSGMINAVEPSTRRNFSTAIKDVFLPVVGHEVGQYQVYPDYDEMSQYTGILKPLNFQIFKERLEKAGMGDQAKDFFKASGQLTALLYREEIEMALRTPGFAGFQLLDLQDYPGQGTALVGLLNAFMKSKGLISAEKFRRFNNDVVLQLLMDKYVWTNRETYSADVQLVNYSPQKITSKEVRWTIVEARTNRRLATGKLPVPLAACGKIAPLGKISFPLQNRTEAIKLLVQLEMVGSNCKIDYPIWVYPRHGVIEVPSTVTVATQLDDRLLEKLKNGDRVLLFPDHEAVKEKSIRPQFISEFWNWLVFKGGTERSHREPSAGTLGILTRPNHPLFNAFPTEFHTNWQWWSIVMNSRPLILDRTDRNYRPIVQVIDNIDRNHKLGLVFEFKVGKGGLLVSMADLPALGDRPEARQFYYSMLQYVASDKFHPQQAISPAKLKALL